MGNQFKFVAMIACLKSVLFVFNILFWFSGLTLLAVGIWTELELHKYVDLSPEFASTGPLVVIGIGAFTVLVCSVAFSCIVKGQPVLLNVYGGFLVCIFVMMVGVALSLAFNSDSFVTGLREGLTRTLTHYHPDKLNFDEVQVNLKCCGVVNYTDWIRLSPHHVIPTSCCVDIERCVTANYNDVYHVGCYEAMISFVHKNINTLSGIALAAGFFPLLGTALACSLASYVTAASYDVMN